MKDLPQKIQNSAHSPKELEVLYRQDMAGFQHAFPKVYNQNPDSILLQAWHERLASTNSVNENTSTPSEWRAADLYIILGIALIAGTFAKLPQFASESALEQFYVRNLGLIVISAIMSYFVIQRKCESKTISWIAGFVLFSFIYVNLTPDPNKSDTSALVSLHLPFVFWSLTGVAFLRGRFRDLPGRMQYIRSLASHRQS